MAAAAGGASELAGHDGASAAVGEGFGRRYVPDGFPAGRPPITGDDAHLPELPIEVTRIEDGAALRVQLQDTTIGAVLQQRLAERATVTFAGVTPDARAGTAVLLLRTVPGVDPAAELDAVAADVDTTLAAVRHGFVAELVRKRGPDGATSAIRGLTHLIRRLRAEQAAAKDVDEAARLGALAASVEISHTNLQATLSSLRTPDAGAAAAGAK